MEVLLCNRPMYLVCKLPDSMAACLPSAMHAWNMQHKMCMLRQLVLCRHGHMQVLSLTCRIVAFADMYCRVFQTSWQVLATSTAQG